MSWTQSEFRQAFRDEVGDAAQLIRDAQIDRWVNQAQARLGTYAQKTAAVTWTAGATSITVPADFRDVVEFVGDDAIPTHRVWGGGIDFTRPAEWAGSAKLYYLGHWPRITTDTPSELPEEGNQACLSFALYRFFKRLASSRADYRRYSTITQANGVDIEELDDLSERHYNDFLDSRESMSVESPLPFFED